MTSKKHGADRNNQNNCTKKNSRLVITQQACIFFSTNEAIHYKYAVVHTYTKNECRNDNVDEVELHTKQNHRSKNNQPTQQNWEKAYQCILQIEMKTENLFKFIYN